MTEEERLVADVPGYLKSAVRADDRSIKQVVVSALQEQYGHEGEASIERRLDEIDRREADIKTEINERYREIEELQDKRERLETQLSAIQRSKREKKDRVLEKADLIPANPDNKFVREKAEELGIEPSELACEIAEYHDKELQIDE